MEGPLLRVEGHSGGARGTDQDALVCLLEFCSHVSVQPEGDFLGAGWCLVSLHGTGRRGRRGATLGFSEEQRLW